MSDINNAEIAVVITEVRRLTKAVEKLLEDMQNHATRLETKADSSDLQQLVREVDIIKERQRVNVERVDSHDDDISKVEDRLSKVEMETWKLGLMMSGSAAGGGVLALIGQYALGLLLAV